MDRAKLEDLHLDPRLEDRNSPYYNDLEKFALFRLSYYMCFKCSNPYFGGIKDTDCAKNDYSNFKPEELVCGKCASNHLGTAGNQWNCTKHGNSHVDFKCKFCCSVAQWFCWGNTHFCDDCHKRECEGQKISKKDKDKLKKCEDPAKCPLKLGKKHNANGYTYALGCHVCRNIEKCELAAKKGDDDE